ncbi:unnamed protein product [Didymodactylos carnosus]|uniref:Uncharacterized protein n=1 Tax=Didymodactylos carnosus TaxID=1234261 RepID=A0A8S2TA78_9BILA|nr:unnamed protein product [Didymodactylos carnosus]CAF4276576.1 unnamed protein product [Didymodactylos carnosus]
MVPFSSLKYTQCLSSERKHQFFKGFNDIAPITAALSENLEIWDLPVLPAHTARKIKVNSIWYTDAAVLCTSNAHLSDNIELFKIDHIFVADGIPTFGIHFF